MKRASAMAVSLSGDTPGAQSARGKCKSGDRNYFRSPDFMRVSKSERSVGEDRLELFHDLLLGMGLGDGELLNQQAARGVEHLALAERQLLVALEHQQIAQHLGDLQRRSGLDLLSVFAIAAVPGLGVAVNLALAQNAIDLVDHVLADHPAQADLSDVLGRDHDRHLLGAENLEHVEPAFGSGNDATLNILDYGHSVGRIYHLLALLERLIHHLCFRSSSQARGFRTVGDRSSLPPDLRRLLRTLWHIRASFVTGARGTKTATGEASAPLFEA